MPKYIDAVQPQAGRLKIVELFETVQGEGHLIGVPSTFIRTGMCNLECPGCDTKWDRWIETDYAEIAQRTKAFRPKHIVVSGGEPTMHQQSLAELFKHFSRADYHITVETNGTIQLSWFDFWSRINLLSCSPKVGSLGPDEMTPRQEEQILKNLTFLRDVDGPQIQLKYVLDPNVPEHVDRVFAFQSRVDKVCGLNDTDVYFQPYDRGTLVNIYNRQEKFNINTEYDSDLRNLTGIVMERSGGRFRVVPQLHKYLSYR